MAFLSIPALGSWEFFVIIIVLLIGALIVFKVLRHLIKAFVTGIIFTAIPLGAKFMGFSIATDAASLLTFMLLGISVYLTTHTIQLAGKITRHVIKPMGRFFKEEDIKHRRVERRRKPRLQ